MPKAGQQAIVIGGSISGLLAARVLADYYESVVVLERDVLPDGPQTRRGVPQGAHVHVALARCSQILGELFPGLLDQLIAHGVPVWADGDLSKLYLSIGGHRLARIGRLRHPAANTAYYPSRAILEFLIRQRVRGLSNVTIRDQREAIDVESSSNRITGVRMANRDGSGEATLLADLVVDATGRGSRTPVFLEKLGYGRPLEEELVVRLSYTSLNLRLPAGALTTKFFALYPEPGRLRGFALAGYENNNWTLTLNSIMGQQLPGTHTEILTFLEDLAPADVLEAVRSAETVGELSRYHVPSNRWRRYDKMRRMPNGLLVVGDAICSFNPIYGQGMTVAALESLVLHHCLRGGDQDLARRFFHDSAKNIGVAWRTAVGADLAIPEVPGFRPVSTRIVNAYLDRVLTAAQTDAVVAERFLSVIGLTEPPTNLLRPEVIFRIIKPVRQGCG
ncbi:FAD-dependent oxidoreductase [Mycobacterium sherrisii]|uniref:FAD-dependent oxidoreductase n=1 Tax=Mycobacterium sherrisii TaxID=243061 RepID=UPI000A0714C0|nr:FAD-dependent monooxygenase [Mycobacterium sherrisii]MCV7031156.1 FAD-dependent monooxygenase [Mycobacterium sherrisii]